MFWAYTLLCLTFKPLSQAWTPIVVKNVIALGSQLTPDVTNVSRDGGYSALINGNIVWLFDDTECMDTQGTQLSFVSNTAAYASETVNTISTLADFGIVNLGQNPDGSPKTAILAHTTVGTGGWIPFQPDELQYNEQMNGKERVAICELSLSCHSALIMTGKYRARNVSDINQHYPSFSLRSPGLCG